MKIYTVVGTGSQSFPVMINSVRFKPPAEASPPPEHCLHPLIPAFLPDYSLIFLYCSWTKKLSCLRVLFLHMCFCCFCDVACASHRYSRFMSFIVMPLCSLLPSLLLRHSRCVMLCCSPSLLLACCCNISLFVNPSFVSAIHFFLLLSESLLTMESSLSLLSWRTFVWRKISHKLCVAEALLSSSFTICVYIFSGAIL